MVSEQIRSGKLLRDWLRGSLRAGPDSWLWDWYGGSVCRPYLLPQAPMRRPRFPAERIGVVIALINVLVGLFILGIISSEFAIIVPTLILGIALAWHGTLRIRNPYWRESSAWRNRPILSLLLAGPTLFVFASGSRRATSETYYGIIQVCVGMVLALAATIFLIRAMVDVIGGTI